MIYLAVRHIVNSNAVFFLLIFLKFTLSIRVSDGLRYPYETETTTNTAYIDKLSIDLDLTDLKITFPGTNRCLTDPSTRIQPRTRSAFEVFATLEPCRDDDPHQLWNTSGTLFTKVRQEDIVAKDPRYPFYAINDTHFGSRWVSNIATGRCILGYWGYSGQIAKIVRSDVIYPSDFFGYIYLSENCSDGPLYNVRTALVGDGYDFKGEDANPRWTFSDIAEVLYFDYPDLQEGKPNSCPEPARVESDTGNGPNPSEAIYRTRTLITQNVQSISVNGTEFTPAIFGCSNNTGALLPSFSPSPIQFALNVYGYKVEEKLRCKGQRQQQINDWPATDDQSLPPDLQDCDTIRLPGEITTQ